MKSAFNLRYWHFFVIFSLFLSRKKNRSLSSEYLEVLAKAKQIIQARRNPPTTTPLVGKRKRRLKTRQITRQLLITVPVLLICFNTTYANNGITTAGKEATAMEISHDFIKDKASIIEDEQEERIRKFLRQNFKQTGIECVIITMRSDQTITEVAIAKIIENNIGQQGENFLVILVLNERLYIAPSFGIRDQIIERHSKNRDEILSVLSEGRIGDGLTTLLGVLFPKSEYATNTAENISGQFR